MSPFIALLLTLGLSIALLWHDSRSKRASGALWLPVLWVFFVASKFPSQWLRVLGLPGGGMGTIEEGNLLDAVVFLALIGCGAIVLARRRVQLFQVIRGNAWLTIFLAYCLISILWSDFPFVAFKRWIKALGHPVMALIILTDLDRLNAIRVVLRRAAFVMVPLSITFIKYFPHLGRSFDLWSGAPMNAGIHHNKNELGYTCMVFGLFFFWNLLASRDLPDVALRRTERRITLLFGGMLAWLFIKADSATAAICTLIGIAAMMLMGSRITSRRFIGTQVAASLMVIAALMMTFDVYGEALRLVGRNETLTDRTELWKDLLAADINPVVGAGFESFWLGDRLRAMWDKWWWSPNQAHSGYLQTYVNLGWIGVFLLACWILSAFRKGRAALLRDFREGQFRLAFLLVILLYNYTEAAFSGVHVVWTMFFLIALEYPERANEARRIAMPPRAVAQVRTGRGTQRLPFASAKRWSVRNDSQLRNGHASSHR